MNTFWAFYGLFILTIRKIITAKRIIIIGTLMCLIPIIYSFVLSPPVLEKPYLNYNFAQWTKLWQKTDELLSYIFSIRELVIAIPILWVSLLISLLLINQELIDHTYVYLISGKLSRTSMLIPKILAGVLVAFIISSISSIIGLLLIKYKVSHLFTNNAYIYLDKGYINALFLSANISMLVTIFIGCLLLVNLFNFIGMLSRKAAVISCIVIIASEYILAFLPIKLAQFTITRTLISIYNSIFNFVLTKTGHTEIIFSSKIILSGIGNIKIEIAMASLPGVYAMLYCFILLIVFASLSAYLNVNKNLLPTKL